MEFHLPLPLPPVPHQVLPPGRPDTGPSLAAVLEEYQDLAEAFSMERAISHPTQRPYDALLTISPGQSANPWRNISDSVAAGIIRNSSSPVGVRFFFVPKKDKTLRPYIDY